jgi:adenylosuccinate lyase
LQLDLTDSTVIRNIGVPLAHTLIALNSLQKGMSKLIINEAAIKHDLEANWAVVAEALQTILRRENYPHPYEALKNLTRTNKPINQASLHEFIDELNISNEVKKEMKAISPHNYTGVF